MPAQLIVGLGVTTVTQQIVSVVCLVYVEKARCRSVGFRRFGLFAPLLIENSSTVTDVLARYAVCMVAPICLERGPFVGKVRHVLRLKACL